MIPIGNHYIPRFGLTERVSSDVGVGEQVSNCNNCAIENVRNFVCPLTRECAVVHKCALASIRVFGQYLHEN